MDARRELVDLLRETRAFLARPGNDFLWSSWSDAADALRELDFLIAGVERGSLPGRLQVRVLFAPTGPIQEVAISSGWGDEFLRLAARFDELERALYS